MAAGLVLGVVHSDQVNIAGVAPMMIYLAAEDRVITIDGLGSWPAAASCERFEREFGGVVPEGLLRTVIPAAPGAWITALQRYGTRSFAEVAQYAIRFAREGFIMYPFLADRLQEAEAKYRRWPSNAAIYLPGGRPPRVGERFVQSDLAASLQYMADQETATAGSRVRKLQAARDAFYQATSPARSSRSTRRTAACSPPPTWPATRRPSRPRSARATATWTSMRATSGARARPCCRP